MDAGTISTLLASTHELDVMVLMLKLLTNNALGLQKRYKKFLDPIVFKLSKGIASLPDELLSIIFKFAVRKEGTEGARQASKLSRVSRRFQKLALEERNLWTTLHSNAKREELETCISRSGSGANFHVFVNDGFNRPHEMDEFVAICHPTTSRWKYLTITTSSNDEGLTENNEVWQVEYIFEFLQRDDVFQLPQLEELNIQCGDLDCYNSLISLSWRSPNLRSLQCTRYLPSPSTSFSSLSAFSFTQNLSYDSNSRVRNLLAFLASTPSISTFDLKISGVNIRYPKPLRVPESVCPSITSFHFRLPGFRISQFHHESRDEIIAAFLQALHMPRLENLAISIDFKNMGDSEIESTKLLNDCSHSLLPVYLANDRARLSSLNYDIKRDADWNAPSELFPIVFTIPLDKVPTVSSLTITTFTRVVFTRAVGGGANGSSEPCRLREVRFSGCEDMGIGDFRSAVQSLGTDIWDTLVRVVVANCRQLGYEEVLEVVGDGKLHYEKSI